ncbi:MAG: porin [Opitutaceae bacterium]|nr:porin [Opitutaceae bacterium]
MFSLKTKSLALLGSLMLGASAVMAQDSATLLDLLVRKGIVTDQEAEDLRADLSKENTAAMVSTSKGPNLDKLVINGRFQAQFVSLGTDISGTAADPATNQHAFLRRIYVGFKPTFGNGWSAFLNYDFAGSTFDAAYIEWTKSPELFVDVGFKKAPIGYEEYFISSGALKSIERSPITRFFVESNNGRRLGAGSYRQGVWVGGKQSNGLSYEFAVTNPEREESSAGAAGVGSAANNNFAYWGTLGYAKSIGGGALKVGGSLGILPDQGGKTLGAGNDLTVWSLYADYRLNDFSLMGEYFGSKNDHGVSATVDSESSGYWIQPSYRFGAYEGVVRYTYVDSDGRGVQTADGIRSAPSGGTMDKLSEWFIGLNWYILGNEAKHDVKFQAGYIMGESKDSITGASGPKAKTDGIRSMMQVNF